MTAREPLSDRIQLFCLAVAMVLLPVLHSRLFLQPYSEIKFFLLDCCLALTAGCSLWRRGAREITPVSVFAGLLCLALLGSTFFAVHKAMALEWSLRFACAALSVAWLAGLARRSATLEQTMTRVFLAAIWLFFGVYAWQLATVGASVPFYSPIGHVNYTAHVYDLWIPLLLLVMVRQNPWQRLAGGVALLLLIQSLVMGGCRGSLFGLLLAGLLVLALRVARRGSARVVLVLVAVLGLAVGLNLLVPSAHNQGLLRQLTSGGLDIEQALGRSNMWRNSWRMFKENPMGVGAGNFQYLHVKYARLGTDRASGVLSDTSILVNSHNSVVTAFVETGVVGGTLFCLLMAAFGLLAMAGAWKGDVRDELFCVAWVTTFLNSLVSAVFFTPVNILYVVVFLALLLARARELGTLRPLATPSFSARPAALLLLLTIPLFGSRLASDYFLVQGMRARNAEDLRLAARLDPWNERVWFELANLAFLGRDFESMRTMVETFLRLYPYNLTGLAMRADSLFFAGRFPEAKHAAGAVLALKKDHPQMLALDKRLNELLGIADQRDKIPASALILLLKAK